MDLAEGTEKVGHNKRILPPVIHFISLDSLNSVEYKQNTFYDTAVRI